MTDESYIKLAIEIAKKGCGYVSPNPLVGCIIVKNDRIIAAGFHEKFGHPHAEINAIKSAEEDLEGSTLYVNLEPCSYHGKTPPCTDEIIKRKIKRVVVGTLDMNPLVSGNGVKKLKASGIDVKVGVLEKECVELNKFFFKFITERLPYVTLKAAQTLDGKIADVKGNSKWISSIASRRYVHSLRSRYDAVLVGAGTVRKDDPRLSVRLTEGRDPKRIILAGKLDLDTSTKVFKNSKDESLMIILKKSSESQKSKIKRLLAAGSKILFAKEDRNGRINLKSALRLLAKEGIASVLVEGGSDVISSFIMKNLYDDIFLFVSPKLLGSGLPVFNEVPSRSMKRALKLKIRNVDKIGDDVIIELVD